MLSPTLPMHTREKPPLGAGTHSSAPEHPVPLAIAPPHARSAALHVTGGTVFEGVGEQLPPATVVVAFTELPVLQLVVVTQVPVRANWLHRLLQLLSV